MGVAAEWFAAMGGRVESEVGGCSELTKGEAGAAGLGEGGHQQLFACSRLSKD